MIRGRSLENAINRALKHYERAGRVGESEKKQLKRLWNGKVIGGAPLDFKMIAWGYGDNRQNVGFAIEAKEIGGHLLEFGEGGIRQTQFDALNEYLDKPGDRRAFVVVDVKTEGEIYRLDWKMVQQEFFERRDDQFYSWRKSIDLKFLRAFGELVKVTGQDDERRAWVLDTYEHEGKATAGMAVVAERAGKPRTVLFGDLESKPAPIQKLTIEQRKANVRAAAESYVRKNARKGWAR